LTDNNTGNDSMENNTEMNIIQTNNTEKGDSTAERFDLEAALARLEDIAGILEKQDTPLRDALDVYSEGVKLIKECRDNLCDVEKEMIVLSKEGENDV
jgi:exodeoxyribonuclease VII small subunit